MEAEKPLVNKCYLLEKFPGKGGWTYAAIPEVFQEISSPFGWVKVKGSIEGFDFRNYKLMPMGNGKLFLPVKAVSIFRNHPHLSLHINNSIEIIGMMEIPEMNL